MPTETKSLELRVPDVRPFDRQENWFASFIGQHILPIAESGRLGRFWFTQYGAVGRGKEAFFRFETTQLAALQPTINAIIEKYPGARYSDWGYVGDIGKGAGSRFLGVNSRNPDMETRANLAFGFLHASAKLLLHCLSGPDPDGYFELEAETASGFNRKTSMEQFHHLFCNLTNVPTFVVVAVEPKSNRPAIVSYETFKGLVNDDARWWNAAQIVPVVN